MLAEAVNSKSTAGIDAYPARALARIWKSMRLSWQMTTMLHRLDGEDRFAEQLRKATFDHLAHSETARSVLTENYVGLPF